MSKQEKNELEQPGQRDDALFEALGRSKKKRRRRILLTVVSVVLVLAILSVAGVSFLRRRVREEFASAAGEVQTYEVTTGTISTVVSGSGTLTDVDLEAVTVPDGVEITGVLVRAADAVAAGDILATVDMASVMTALSDLQTQIEELDEQISDAEDDKATTTITAGVSGRVKAICAEPDTAVADAMYEHGALAVLSLDGYMAVDIQTDALAAGDSVTVLRSDGSELAGTVESVTGGTATILVTDNGPALGETVIVENSEGTLYIHSPLRVTGYAGTVSRVRVEENDKVSASTKLFTLTDTAYSANYDALMRSRSELEETLLALLAIRQHGAVTAPVSGSVASVDYADGGTAVATLSPDEKMSVTISVDESDILALELGQQVTVTVSSVSEETFFGTLTEIDRTSASSGTYSAVIELAKAEGMLSGMTASVSVRIEGVDNAILIPVDALHQTRDSAYVYTTYDEETQEYGGRVDVVVGIQNSSYVEIKSGLSVGDTVYYTESGSSFGGFGNMGFGDRGQGAGAMPAGGQMPDLGSGEMPDFGGQMPEGGQRPGGSGRG